jgi:hypothetical protein
MNMQNMSAYWQHIERNGCCLSIEEKMRMSVAMKELCCDLKKTAKDLYFVAKITGKLY